MNNPYDVKLQQLRKQWKEKPHLRTMTERIARALQEREKEYLKRAPKETAQQ